MIRYGVCIGSDERYQQCAVPGLQLVDATDRTIESRDNSSIFTAYNRMLDQVRDDDDLEALVLLHEDLELRDPDFEAKVRDVLADPEVAIVGAIGGRGVRNVRWSKSAETFGRMLDPVSGEANDLGGGRHDVDIVDGCILVLSPWAVRNLRFDEERFRGFHAYDADICMQARAAGRKVQVAEFDAFHHSRGGFGNRMNHARSDARFRSKWGIPKDPRKVQLATYSPATYRRLRKVGALIRGRRLRG